MTETRKLLRIYTEEPGIRGMAALASAGIALAAFQGGPWALGLLAMGWGLYLVEEHLIHRFIFQCRRRGNQFLFDLLYRLHYGHHDQDRNRYLLFTPLWFALPMTLVTVGVLSIVLPVKDALIAVLGGGVRGYLLFEWLHLTSHVRTSSKGRLGRYITRRHAKHHYIDYTNWYTVSPGGELVDRRSAPIPRSPGSRRTCGRAVSIRDDPRLVRSRIRFGCDASLANIAGLPVQRHGDARHDHRCGLLARPRRLAVDGSARRGVGNPAIPATSAAGQLPCRPRFRARCIPGTGRPARRRGGYSRLVIGRVRPRRSEELRVQRRTWWSTDPIADGRSSTVKPRSSGAARTWRSRPACCANGGDGSPNSALDVLGPSNTPFSLVEPETALESADDQGHGVFRSHVGRRVRAGRRTPAAASGERWPLRLRRRDARRRPRGAMGDPRSRFASRAPSSTLDWCAHVFGGLSRRPTFVPRFTPDVGLAAVDAVYTEILQVGGELETTRADWRFFAEGFGRRGAVDVTGRERTYGYVAAAAEYQRLGAFGGRYNFIPRFEFMADTRGDRADIPFARRCSAGMRVARTGRLPLQLEMGYSYDWVFRGHGVMASVEKAAGRITNVESRIPVHGFPRGTKPSVLDIWEDDLELNSYVRIELSR